MREYCDPEAWQFTPEDFKKFMIRLVLSFLPTDQICTCDLHMYLENKYVNFGLKSRDFNMMRTYISLFSLEDKINTENQTFK